jgi:hypothetical protein
MKQQITVVNGPTISFVGALTLAFVVLKLTDVIAWSWWWVLSPLWIQGCIIITALVFVLLIAFIVVWWGDRR